MGQVNLKITAEDRATAVLERMAASGKNASDRLQTAFDQLGVKTEAAFNRQRQAAQGAYDRIKASGVATAEELTRAEKALAAQLNKIDKEATGAARGMDKVAHSAHGAHGKTTLFHNSLVNTIMGFGMLGMATQTVLAPFNALIDSATTLDRVTNTLKASIGPEGVGAEMAYVRSEAARLGLDLASAADGYAKLTAAARGTSLAGQGVRDIFSAVTEASTAMGLSASDTEGMLRAITQMMSKGTVQAEELRGQLGERLPGAFEMAAKAMGVSTQQLNKMLEQGEVLAVDLLPKLAQALHEQYGEAAIKASSSVQAELNKLSTAWLDLKGNMADSGTIAASLHILTVTVETLGNNLDVVVVGLTTMTGVTVIRNIGALTTALRAMAASTALATGGLSLLFGAAAAGGYMLGEYLAGEAEKADESLRNVDGTLKMMASHSNTAASTAKVIAEAQRKEEEALKAQEKALKSAVPALDRYSRSIGDLGREQLKMAESGFSRDLERQEEFFKKTGAAAANLSAPIRSYLSVLDQVYGAQLAAQQDIAAALETIGADQAARLQQEINIANTERALAEGRLKGWSSYYDKLKAMHASALETMAKKQEELLAVKQFGADLGKALNEKFNGTEALTPYEQFFRDLEGIDADAARAMELSGQKKIDALQAVMNRLKSLPEEVRDGDQVIISSLDIYEKASERFRQMQTAAESAKQAEIAAAGSAAAALQAEMAVAQMAMADLQEQVLGLDEKIAALTKTVTLSLDDQASSKVAEIQSAMDRLQDKEITITANYVSNIAGGGAGPAPGGASGVIASGTPSGWSSNVFDGARAGGGPVDPFRTYLVGERGPELLRMGGQGGTVIPSERIGGQVTIAPVFQISGIAPSGREKTARELAREIEPELRKLGERYRG